ncbi:hypothetical protein BH20ACT17_BH20ACT17_14200 [soil metagenome]
MGALDRLPPWSTTGVGSLPYSDGRLAAARAVADYDLPFCPQLPRVEGEMVAEWLGADPRRCGWSPDRDRERPRAWEWLLRELTLAPPAHDVVKLQVTGPLTLACALERGAGRVPGDAALRCEVAAWLAGNVGGQVAALHERGLNTLVMVDEPALGAVAAMPGIERCWDPLRALGAPWGLHLCCAVPWDVVDRAAPDVLSFDLVAAPVDRRAATTLRGLLRRGGRVAWGVLPVHREEPSTAGSDRLAAAVGRCDADGAQSLLTASCGTGRQSARREQQIARGLRDLAGRRRAPVS